MAKDHQWSADHRLRTAAIGHTTKLGQVVSGIGSDDDDDDDDYDGGVVVVVVVVVIALVVS